MKTSNWSRSSNPKFYQYVMVEMLTVMHVPKIVYAISKHGFMSATALRTALTPNLGPLLHLVPDLRNPSGQKRFGFTTDNPALKMTNGIVPPANAILLEKALADEFETTGPRITNTSADPAQNRRVIRAGATILHELCHWGDWQAHNGFTDGGATGVEHGDDFDVAVYGAIL
jgi:hypothetical protein